VNDMAHARGFSLVEMVVAVLIFSLAVTAVLGVFAAGLRSTAVSLNHTQGVFLAQGLVEEVLAADQVEVGQWHGEFGLEFPDAWWTRMVESTDTPDLYRLRVEVSCPEHGTERTVELVTLVAGR